MASLRRDVLTEASTEVVWSVIRDIGALHTRLVPGFVVDTKLEPGARIVTFTNGMVVREPIVAIDDVAMRLVWSAEGGSTKHYNASVQVLPRFAAGQEASQRADTRQRAMRDAASTASRNGQHRLARNAASSNAER